MLNICVKFSGLPDLANIEKYIFFFLNFLFQLSKNVNPFSTMFKYFDARFYL